MKFDCEGNPSITNYGRGCRCLLCKQAKSTYERELRERHRKDGPPKKPSGKRDNPVVFSDAFTREEILRARS